ncbi:hypothetical protein CHS0354_033792 [Potamilus streckersoni]|uniref:C-type lectin domain-containing protein n=1 Tax=Potamilus streckersoni TaxID=2493646 RepID=A0AAE0VU75_9BIVA|nr:hypothetical protein CHS0354_033792 [Potamilus streckersoni]
MHHNKSLYWLNGEPLMYSNLRQNTSDMITGFAITIDSTDYHKGWIPQNVQSLYGFICEKSLATSWHGNKSLNVVCNGTEGFQMDSRGMVCVKMITDMRLNWRDAREYCRHIKSYLLDLSHDAKQDVVMEILGTNNLLYDFWFGLHERNGIWYWDYLRQATWFKWQSGHPSAYPESTACAVVWQEEWFATSCEDKRHFICERVVSW